MTNEAITSRLTSSLVLLVRGRRVREDELREKNAGNPLDIKAYTFEQITSMTDEELDADRDPIEAALTDVIVEIGWALFAIGGTELMGTVCEEVADQFGKEDERGWGFATDVLDKNWDMIGDKNDFWTA